MTYDAADDLSPYVAALETVKKPIKEIYFFPGHCGGRYIPSSLQRIMKNHGGFMYDLPELDGLDNIHAPEGPLLESLQAASKLYDSLRTWYLVNGSTSGILAAILAFIRIHQRYNTTALSDSPVFLIGKDSHKSVYDGLSLGQCDAVLLPCEHDREFGVPLGVSIQSIEAAIKEYKSRVAGLILTRPSYQGVAYTSDSLKQIIALCHKNNIPVIIDEAHGSHLRFLNDPKLQDGLACGADVVVQSTHKTLTSLSQTGMLHVSKDAFKFNPSRDIQQSAVSVIQECYSMVTSTSPNSLFLASLDATTRQFSVHGRDMINEAKVAATHLRDTIRNYDFPAANKVVFLDDSVDVRSRSHLAVDPLRVSIKYNFRARKNSIETDDAMCDERGIYCELNLSDCISYGVPPGATMDTLLPLQEEIIRQCLTTSSLDQISHDFNQPTDVIEGYAERSQLAYIHIKDTVYKAPTAVLLANSIGKVSAETICLYPPGTPIISRGETINAAHVKLLKVAQSEAGSGCTITGSQDPTVKSINVY